MGHICCFCCSLEHYLAILLNIDFLPQHIFSVVLFSYLFLHNHQYYCFEKVLILVKVQTQEYLDLGKYL